jgi:hypothetical protein
MTSSVHTVATALVGLAVGIAGPALAAPTLVDPGDATRGADPVVAWFDKDAAAIQAEGRTIPVDLPGQVLELRHAEHGYLVQRVVGAGDLLDHVSLTGETRRLASEVLDWEVLTGQGAGRRVAVLMSPETGRVVVRVVRSADGKLLAARPAPRHLHDFHRGRVWMDGAEGELVTWDPATGNVSRRGPAGTVAVDARNGLVARRSGGCLRIAPLRAGAGWSSWCAAENGFLGWSPDGRHVLTHTLPADADGVTRKLVVRDARTGRLVRVFRGYFGTYPEIRWEGNGRFLVMASDPDFAVDGAAVMRLRLDGRVVRASRLGGTYPWEISAVPASPR